MTTPIYCLHCHKSWPGTELDKADGKHLCHACRALGIDLIYDRYGLDTGGTYHGGNQVQSVKLATGWRVREALEVEGGSQ